MEEPSSPKGTALMPPMDDFSNSLLEKMCGRKSLGRASSASRDCQCSVRTLYLIVESNAARQPRPKAGAQRTLEGVGWTRWLGALDSRDSGLPRLYPFNS